MKAPSFVLRWDWWLLSCLLQMFVCSVKISYTQFYATESNKRLFCIVCWVQYLCFYGCQISRPLAQYSLHIVPSPSLQLTPFANVNMGAVTDNSLCRRLSLHWPLLLHDLSCCKLVSMFWCFRARHIFHRLIAVCRLTCSLLPHLKAREWRCLIARKKLSSVFFFKIYFEFYDFFQNAN